ncbi:MAG TPA: hypothetical protein VK604_21685 [Bryobacteraceae bacterium]|nr:hypothetical protein [Bryobacteraceae bacterium]
MVLSPALRGLFGLDFDAAHKTLRLAPHLPATWDRVQLHRVPLGDMRLDVEMVRSGANLSISANASAAVVFCLASQTAQRDTHCEHPARSHEQLTLPLPGVEVELAAELLEPGSLTRHAKVIEEKLYTREYTIILEGPPRSTQLLKVRRNQPDISVQGGTASGSDVIVTFPDGPGVQQQQVSFRW